MSVIPAIAVSVAGVLKLDAPIEARIVRPPRKCDVVWEY